MKNKVLTKIVVLILILVLLLGGAVSYLFMLITPGGNRKVISDKERTILIFEPQIEQSLISPLKILGQAKGSWYFEGQFKAELYDEQGSLLGTTPLRAQGDWATEDFVPFEGELVFSTPTSTNGLLRFLSDNPSGLPENQKIVDLPVKFGTVSSRQVLLYYYNPERDRDESGNIKCSREGLVSVPREIPLTKTPIQDTINLLIAGSLTEEEKSQGVTTEYPLEGFSLLETNLKSDGTLILKFKDPLNKTSGGACRAGILWFQIEATAKQFPEVKKVEFLPEELFQP
ncbi:MAG: hypothetical protein GYA31_01245 [Parcubacteria group bacterium]|nr:hypothetical protein [Parcubacteria group bacterium]